MLRPARGGALLLQSDLADLAAARREVTSWASENGLDLPRQPVRLALTDSGQVVREYTVVPTVVAVQPTPPSGHRFATSPGLRLLTGGQPAA